MSSSLPPNPTFSSERKYHGKASNRTAMALTLWILLVVIFVQSAQAGVIKKREIPFTKDLTPEMAITTTTATNSAPTLGTVTTIRPTMHDPDIEEREATTLLSAPKIAAALAESRNNDSTRLVLHPTAEGATADYSSSKEYMLNEIALNETKKLLKFANDEQLLAKKEETEIVLSNGTIQGVNNILETITSKPNQEAGKDLDNSLNLKPVNALTLESSSEPIVEKVAHETLINSQQDLKSTGNDIASEKNVDDVLSKVQIHNETISGFGTEEVGNGIALKGFENNPISQINLSEQNSADKEVTKSLTNAMESSANKSEPEINNLNNLLSKGNSNINKFQNISEASLAIQSPNTASSKISQLGNDIVLNTENKSVSPVNSKDVLQGNGSKEYQQTIQEIKTLLEASTADNVQQQSLQDLKPHMEISSESPIKEEQLHEAGNESQNILMNTEKASKLNEETSKENLLHKMDDNKEMKNETLPIGPETTTIKSELGKDVTLHTVPNNSSLESSKDNVDVQTGYQGHHQENDLVKTHNQTDVTVKDNSLETNHISDLTKATTEHSSESQQQQSIFSTNANNTDNTIPSDSLQNKTDFTYGGMHVQDGLDKTVWKDVTNDLPEKTTEKIPKETDTQIVDLNKLDYGRSMFKTETEAEAEESFTENVHIANNIDFGNASNSSIAGERGKKPKFINDNSTNAQQMNLPNNAEVWSLAGMKGLLAMNSSTMETAPKHKEGERDSLVGAQLESPIINRTHLLNSRPNTNSEKFLLDWSHIIMDKELSSTVRTTSYDEDGGNNEVRENIAGDSMTHKLLTEKPSTYELEGETKSSSEFSGTPSISTDTTTAANPITANSTTTILSLMSDKVLNEQGDKQNTTTDISAVNERVTLASPSQSSAADGITSKEIELTEGGVGGGETSTLPAEIVASPKSVVTHEQLQQPDSNNEINLTLNKTLTAVDEFTAGEPDNSNRVTNPADKDNETERVTVMTTAVIEESNAKTTSAAAVEEATAVSSSSSSSSTLDTGNENTTAGDVNAATVLKNSQDFKENNENENPEILLNTTEFAITTFRPKFAGVTNNTGVNLDPTTVIGSTPITERNPLAEVNDQNGNNEIEQKQSINIENTTTPATTTTPTTSSETSSFNNISSTIKTHLNEQVLLETTTELIITTTTPLLTTTTAAATKLVESESDLEATTTTETLSEKTTSSSKDNEIINEGIADIHLNETITTPKSLEENAREGEEEHQVEEEQVQTTTETVNRIGSATSSPTPLAETTKTETEQQQQEIETTTNFTESKQGETPVVDKPHEGTNLTLSQENNESLITTTTTLPEIIPTSEAEEETQEENKEKANGEDTTTQVVDTYSEYPEQNKDIEKEPAVFTTTTETALESETTINENDKELETTTNMSLIPPSTTPTSTTIEPILNSTSKEEETFINLLDDSTTSAPSSTTIATTEIPIITTSTTRTTTTSGTIEITSKIEEIYKVITSSTTEATWKTTTKAPEEELLLTTTTRIPQQELPTTITNMIPTTTTTTTTTTPSPSIINGDMVGGADDKSSLTPTIDTILVGNSGNMFTKNTETASGGETDVNVIIAITVSIIGVIALILLVAFLYLMRKRQKQTSYSQRCRPVSLDEYTIDNGSIGGSIRKSSALRSSKRTYGNLAFDDPSIRHNALGVHELAKFASEKLRIFEEFRDVPQITAREDEVPQGCEDKNRYANVLPLPETRVVLQRLNEDEKTEYINANYVTGPKDAPNYYIACQAPLDSTVEDFWRMIWEQQSRVIIQATDLVENGVEKCAEYLPPSVTLDNHSTFGDFQITLQNREIKDKYAISTLLLKHTGENNVTRELTHYWYKWPETGVPNEEAPIIAMLLEARSSLISYATEQANEDKEKSSNGGGGGATLKAAEEGTAAVINTTTNGSSSKDGERVNGEINGNISMVPIKKTARNQGPLTIHCSPGTGRTGTIIACDIAIRSLETPKRTVDIPHIVYYVRRGRASAVLTKEQYEFIYKVASMYAAKISNPTNYN